MSFRLQRYDFFCTDDTVSTDFLQINTGGLSPCAIFGNFLTLFFGVLKDYLYFCTIEKTNTMARQAREISGTGIYHVMMRGINRQIIFEDDEDYRRFTKLL